MSDATIIYRPVGGLDKESAVHSVVEGNYVNGHNLAFHSDYNVEKSGTRNSVKPILGNRFAFDLGAIAAQNKKYRIHMPVPDTDKLFTFIFKSPNKDATFGTVPFSALTTMSDPAADLATEINSYFASSAHNVTATAGVGYVDVEYLNYNYINWHIENTQGLYFAYITATQDAIDKSLEGPLHPIAGRAIDNRIYLWSTTRERSKELLPVQILGVTLSGPITLVSFTGDHGLQEGEVLEINGSSHGSMNGKFTIHSVPSTNSLNLITGTAFGVTLTAYPNIGTEKLYKNSSGIGEIGVAIKNEEDDWTYTRLIRSSQLNFRREKNIDHPQIEIDSFRTSFYFTDGQIHGARAMYYEQDEYVTDGFLYHTDPDKAIYHLDHLNEATDHILRQPDVEVWVQEVLQGGKIPSGNKRYAARLLTHNLTETDFTEPSNFINVHGGDESDIQFNPVIGEEEGTITDKRHRIRLAKLNPYVYKFFEIAVIHYGDTSQSAEIIYRKEITLLEDEVMYKGTEKTNSITVAEIIPTKAEVFDTAKGLILEDKYALHNDTDLIKLPSLEGWAKTFLHRIKVKYLNQATVSYPGEYQLSINTQNHVGYRLQETYRIQLRGQDEETGKWSEPVWLDDLRFDPLTNNTANPDDDRRDQTGTNLLTNYDLTSGTTNGGHRVHVPYFDLFGFDWDYKLENGKTVRETYKRIQILREKAIPEIIAGGIGVMTVDIIHDLGLDYGIGPDRGLAIHRADVISDNIERVEFPFAYSTYFPHTQPSGTDFYSTQFNFTVPTATATPTECLQSNKDHVVLYLPDYLFGAVDKNDIDHRKVKLRVWKKLPTKQEHTRSRLQGYVDSYHLNYYFESEDHQYTDYDIEWLEEIEKGGTSEKSNRRFCRFLRALQLNRGGTFTSAPGDWSVVPTMWNQCKTILVKTRDEIEFDSDHSPVFKVELVRIESYDKFGDKRRSDAYSTGAFLSRPESTTPGPVPKDTLNVFGGDTFTQRAFIQHRYENEDTRLGASPNWGEMYKTPHGKGGADVRPGFAGSHSFYSQNRFNIQMRYTTDTQRIYPAEQPNIIEWGEKTDKYKDQFTYSRSYTPLLSIFRKASFDPLVPERKTASVRVHYSDQKVIDGQKDAYRNIKPANKKDLNLTDGPIRHVETYNGELVIFQDRAYRRGFLNQNGQLQIKDAQDIIIGSGETLASKFKKLSDYGSQHKFSVVKGRSQGGKDIIYYLNADAGVFVRIGDDGTQVLSKREPFAEEMRRMTQWVRDKDAPFLNDGVVGVWDEQAEEVIMTLRGRRGENHVIGKKYFTGDVVQNIATSPLTFEGLPDVFICNTSHNSTSSIIPGVTPGWESYWTIVPRPDQDYYSDTTIIYNEAKDKFTCTTTPMPRLYVPFRSSYISGHPGKYPNTIFEHREGNYLSWYDYKGEKLTDQGYLEFIINAQFKDSKDYEAIQIASFIAPFRVEMATINDETGAQWTYLDRDEFELMEGKWTAPIKNDALPFGSNTDDTTTLFGPFIRVKVFFQPEEYNRFDEFLVKVCLRSRLADN